MTAMQIGVTLNAGPLLGFFRAAIKATEGGLGNPDLRQGHEDAQRVYLSTMSQRFAAEGDGSWEQLAWATRRERSHLGFPPAHPILKRLGLLRAGLIPGAPGNLFETSPDRVRAGYGGAFRHPGYRSPSGRIVGGNVRLADIAAFHDKGTAKVPKRQILVPPSQQTLQSMKRPIASGVRAMLDRAVAAGLASRHG